MSEMKDKVNYPGYDCSSGRNNSLLVEQTLQVMKNLEGYTLAERD
jgi:hypothetical protein